jgi:hypothetical protein
MQELLSRDGASTVNFAVERTNGDGAVRGKREMTAAAIDFLRQGREL